MNNDEINSVFANFLSAALKEIPGALRIKVFYERKSFCVKLASSKETGEKLVGMTCTTKRLT